MICVVIQVRLDSSRLPQKALLDLDGKPVIVQVMENARKIIADSYILACDYDSEKIVSPLAASCGFVCIAGPKEDVLERFCMVIRKTGAEYIIRLTGDNPYIFVDAVNASLYRFFRLKKEQRNIDYFTWSGLPHGSGVEVLVARRLLEASVLSNSQYDHEHVGPALYNHPDRFDCVREKAPEQWFFPDLRTTIDTREDYERACLIAQFLRDNGTPIPVESQQILQAWNYVTKVVVFVPSHKLGRGTGHLQRSFSLIRKLHKTWRCQLFIPQNKTLPIAVPEDIKPHVVQDLPEKAQAIILDNFRTSLATANMLKKIAPVIAIDEGGFGRSSCDYLLDVIPGPVGKISFPNQLNPSFLSLPKARKQNEVKNIRSVLVVAGGEDAAGLAQPVAQILVKMDFDVTLIDPTQEGVKFVSEGYTLSGPIQKLVETLCHYDLVVTHYGFTAFEALAAGCKVLLFSPSRYHYLLAKKYFFSVIPYKSNLKFWLSRILSKPIKVSKIVNIHTVSKEISEEINNLAHGKKRVCPLCSCDKGQILARAIDKTIIRCARCKLMYISFQVKKISDYTKDYFFEEYKAHYGKTYLEDFNNIKKQGQIRINHIQTIIKQKKLCFLETQKNLLDIGCAYGPFLDAARQKGWTVFGTDINQDAIDYVTDNLNIPAWVSSFPAPDNKNQIFSRQYSVVSLWYVIEHFEDLETVFAAIQKLLIPGGILAFSTPSGTGVSAKKNFAQFISHSPNDHISIWEPQRVRRQLERFGFSVISVVSTGHHPERFPLPFSIKKGSFLWKLFLFISKVFFWGDTFEVYAIKRGSMEDIE